MKTIFLAPSLIFVLWVAGGVLNASGQTSVKGPVSATPAVQPVRSPQNAVDEAKRKALIMPGLPGGSGPLPVSQPTATSTGATRGADPKPATNMAGSKAGAPKPGGPNLAKAPKGAGNLLDLPAITETEYQPSKRDPFLSSDAVDTIVRSITTDVEEPSVDPINNLAVIILDYIQQNFEAQGISISRNNRFALVNNRHVTVGDYMAIALEPDVVSRIVNSVESGGERIHVNESYTRIYLLVKTITPDAIGLELPTFPDPLRIEYHKNYEIVKTDDEEEEVLKAKDLPPESNQGEETVTAPTKEGTFRNLPFLTPGHDKKEKGGSKTPVKPKKPLLPQAAHGKERGQIR